MSSAACQLAPGMKPAHSEQLQPQLKSVINSHKLVRARQSTFTPGCLQKLQEFYATSQQLPTELQLSDILLPDFVCEIVTQPEAPERQVLVLADCLLLLCDCRVSGDLSHWCRSCVSRQDWLWLVSELQLQTAAWTSELFVEAPNCESAIRVSGSGVQLQLQPLHCSSHTVFDLLCCSRELDIGSLFVQLPRERKPSFLGLQTAASAERHMSQASLMSQVPLSSSPCSTKFFKKKFDSLWGYFNFRAPAVESSKMFYGALGNPDLETNLYVARKPKAKRQKMWTVLKGQTVYVFKKRSGACNAEYQVNLESLAEVQTLEEASRDAKAESVAEAIALSSCNTKTLVLKFENSKKQVLFTPLDKFDFKRWEEAISRVLQQQLLPELSTAAASQLHARRISGLSNSFHNLSSAGASQRQSPTFSRKDGGLAITRNSREMMASCTNLDELGGRQSPGRCGAKFSPVSAASAAAGMPIITVEFSEDPDSDEHLLQQQAAAAALPDDAGVNESDGRRSSLESIDQLTPEEVAELKRRRISTQIQLECLQAEIKKRELHLSPQQMQTLNSQMSDLYEDLQDMSTTISKVDSKKQPVRGKKKSF